MSSWCPGFVNAWGQVWSYVEGMDLCAGCLVRGAEFCVCSAWGVWYSARYGVLCEVCICVSCYARGMEFCHMFCARYGVLCEVCICVSCYARGMEFCHLFCLRCVVLREIWSSVPCPARGMQLCVSYSVLGMEFCVRCSGRGMQLCVRYSVLGMELDVLPQIWRYHDRGYQGLLKCNAMLSGSLVSVWEALSAFGMYLSVSLHVITARKAAIRTCIIFVNSVMNLFVQFAGFHVGCWGDSLLLGLFIV